MGYAAPPGGGPAGETCGSCAHAERKVKPRGGYWGCACNRQNWNMSRRTDIALRSPACSRWEKRQEGADG